MDPSFSDVPFSLVCETCDAGRELGSYQEANADGWSDITRALDLPMANYVGLCPACRREADVSGRRN